MNPSHYYPMLKWIAIQNTTTYRMQDKRVVGLNQVFEVIFLQTHESFQVGTVPARTVQTMYHVLLFLLFNEKHIKDFFFALAAIVGGFVLSSSVETNLHSFRAYKLSYQLGMA